MKDITQKIGFKIYQTVMSVKELVDKTEPDVFNPETLQGYQRQIDDSHCEGIIDYIMNNDFFFPSPIICSTRDNDHNKKWVVDGQHRIQAFRLLNNEENPEYFSKYKEIEDCTLPVIVLDKPDISNEVSTFITINKTGKKVDTSLAYILRNKITNITDDEVKNKIKVDYLIVELAQRISTQKGTIWNNQVSFEGNPKLEGKMISLNAFVKAERSFVNKLIKCKLIDIDWEKNEKKIETALTDLDELFWFKWNVIQNKWNDLFKGEQEKRAILQGPIGCASINKLIGYKILDDKQPLTKDEYFSYLVKVFLNLNIPYENWIRGVKYSIYSSEAGYTIVSKDLEKNCSFTKKIKA